MGWCHPHDADGAHEGHAVALVDHGAPGRFRELGYPHDAKPCTLLAAVQAGCDCGWRSPRIAATSARWDPFCVTVSDFDEGRLVRYWRAHVDSELRLGTYDETGPSERLIGQSYANGGEVRVSRGDGYVEVHVEGHSFQGSVHLDVDNAKRMFTAVHRELGEP